VIAVRKLSIRAKLAVLITVFLGGLLAFGATAFAALEALRVNGPLYQRIVLSKDIIADVLPPPEYLVETYLLALQLAHTTSPAEQDALVRRGEALRAEYEARHAFWVRTLAPGPLRDSLVERSYQPALVLLDLRDQELVPAVRAGDVGRARALLDGPLKAAYDAHRAAIDDVVAQATVQAAADEAVGTQLIRRWTALLVGILAGTTAVGLGVAVVIARAVARPVAVLVEASRRLARGEVAAASGAIEREYAGSKRR
jgi:methyl-accepting chemotaxis protein